MNSEMPTACQVRLVEAASAEDRSEASTPAIANKDRHFFTDGISTGFEDQILIRRLFCVWLNRFLNGESYFFRCFARFLPVVLPLTTFLTAFHS
jgi:hypothetical protein